MPFFSSLLLDTWRWQQIYYRGWLETSRDTKRCVMELVKSAEGGRRSNYGGGFLFFVSFLFFFVLSFSIPRDGRESMATFDQKHQGTRNQTCQKPAEGLRGRWKRYFITPAHNRPNISRLENFFSQPSQTTAEETIRQRKPPNTFLG